MARDDQEGIGRRSALWLQLELGRVRREPKEGGRRARRTWSSMELAAVSDWMAPLSRRPRSAKTMLSGSVL